jgi:hypothetical protein
MTGLARRATLLVALSLLTSAATVSAECPYACGTHRVRGNAACIENHSLPMTRIHQAVVFALHEVLTPERLEAAIQDYADTYAREGEQRAVLRAVLAGDVARLDDQLAKLADAVAGGAAVDTLLGAIKVRETERRALRARLDTLDAEEQAAGRISRADFVIGMHTVCKDWRTMLNADPARGRKTLRDLRVERVVVTRLENGSGWSYRIEGGIDKLLAGRFFTVVEDNGMSFEVDVLVPAPLPASQQEVEQDSCPRGDSNTRHAV